MSQLRSLFSDFAKVFGPQDGDKAECKVCRRNLPRSFFGSIDGTICEICADDGKVSKDGKYFVTKDNKSFELERWL